MVLRGLAKNFMTLVDNQHSISIPRRNSTSSFIDSLLPVLAAPGHISKIIKLDHVEIYDSCEEFTTMQGIQKFCDQLKNYIGESNVNIYDLFLDSASSLSFKVACPSTVSAFALLLRLKMINKWNFNASFYSDSNHSKLSFPVPFDFNTYSMQHPFIIESQRVFKIPQPATWDHESLKYPFDFTCNDNQNASVRRDSVISASNSEAQSPGAGIVSRRKSGADIKFSAGGKGGIIDAQSFKLIGSGLETRTTVMIRNIPNKYTPTMLQEFLDIRVRGLYNFLYLRMDFKNKCNVGYAFINFVSPKSILLLKDVVGEKMPKFKSEKKLAISFASIQGLDRLVDKFQNSSIMLQDDKDWRPKLYHTENGPLKGTEKAFPKPKDGQYRAKSEVLYCRQ